MKVDKEALNLEIQEKLNVDLSKYQNEEIAQNVIDLLAFPIYIANWVIRPILIAIGLFALGFFVLELGGVEKIIYSILGFGLFLLSGLLAGLVFLVYKLKKDIIGITYYAFDIMEQVKEDQNIMKQGSGQENQSERMSLLFKGIIHIVMIPILGKAMAEKVPIVGGFASGLLEKILSGIASRFKFDDKDATIGKEVNSSENSEFNQELFSSRIAASKEGVRKVVGFTTNIARYPLLFVLFISLFMLFVFIYIIN